MFEGGALSFISLLSKKLAQGECVITAELSPPRGSDVSTLLSRAEALKPLVDAINIPDCQRAMLKLSSMVASIMIQQQVGVETVWQLTCRDRNLIALQSDLLGGWAMGLCNLLALTGDPVQVGDQAPMANQVFHLEAIRLLDLLQRLNSSLDAQQAPLKAGGTSFCVGSALNLARLHGAAQQQRLRQKLERGVNFFQTQPVYDQDTLLKGLEVVSNAAIAVGVTPPPVLLGLVPPKSAEAARRFNQTVPGIHIPADWIEALEQTQDPKTSMRISFERCGEWMQQAAPLVQGLHLMPVGIEASFIQYWQANPAWIPKAAATIAN